MFDPYSFCIDFLFTVLPLVVPANDGRVDAAGAHHREGVGVASASGVINHTIVIKVKSKLN